jgi:hypothetical protein
LLEFNHPAIKIGLSAVVAEVTSVLTTCGVEADADWIAMAFAEPDGRYALFVRMPHVPDTSTHVPPTVVVESARVNESETV